MPYLIIAAVLLLLTVLSAVNYRRFFPKPRALGNRTYAVRTVRHRVELEGRTIYGELLIPQGIEGKLPCVICCHGFGSNYRLCEKAIGRWLAMSGCTVYCFDFFGGNRHSKSGGAMAEMSVLTEKSDLIGVLDDISTLETVDDDRLYLLGESQGGMVSALAAPERADKIRALVLYYPALCIPFDAHKRFASKESIPEHYRVFSMPVGRRYDTDAYDIDVYREIRGYDKPVLILHGDRDTMVDVSYGRDGAAAYRQARLEILPGEIHGFTGEGKKKAARLTYEFLQENGLGVGTSV